MASVKPVKDRQKSVVRSRTLHPQRSRGGRLVFPRHSLGKRASGGGFPQQNKLKNAKLKHHCNDLGFFAVEFCGVFVDF